MPTTNKQVSMDQTNWLESRIQLLFKQCAFVNIKQKPRMKYSTICQCKGLTITVHWIGVHTRYQVIVVSIQNDYWHTLVKIVILNNLVDTTHH